MSEPTEEQRQRDIRMVGETFDHLYKARLREERNVASLFSPDLEYQLYRTLDGEIQATGQTARDAIRRMADSFDRAMTAVANAARAWEDRAKE